MFLYLEFYNLEDKRFSYFKLNVGYNNSYSNVYECVSVCEFYFIFNLFNCDI